MKNPVTEAGIAPEPGVLLLHFDAEARRVGDLLVVGNDEGTMLAVRADESVVSIDASTSRLVRFMNVSAAALAECIRAYQRYGASVAACASEAEEQACVDELEASLRAIDPDALSSPGTWWSCIVEQARDGML